MKCEYSLDTSIQLDASSRKWIHNYVKKVMWHSTILYSLDIIWFMLQKIYLYLWDGAKLSKIDVILVCNNFIDLWPLVLVIVLWSEYFDHFLIIFQSYIVDFGPPPFTSYNSWISNDTLFEVFKNMFITLSVGKSDFILFAKLKVVKEAINVAD